MHRVVQIPELLALIFKYLQSTARVQAACVCTAWSSIALDALWRQVDEFRRLVELLAPVEEDPSDFSYSFVRPPEPEDWDRFTRYALRVRRLRFQSHDASCWYPNQSVFDTIARTRTRLHVLPHLHTLEWIHLQAHAPASSAHTLSLATVLMNEGVRHFAVWLPVGPSTELSLPFREILARMPHLTHLDVRTVLPMRAIEPEMLFLLGGLPCLQTVVLPCYHFTQRIAEALGRLERLQVVEFQYPRVVQQGHGDPADVQVFTPCLGDRAFASLSELSLAVRLQDLANLLTGAFASGLRVLYVDSPHEEGPGPVHALLHAASEQCPSLAHLTVVCKVSPGAASHQPAPADRISFAALKPLLACPHLVHFELAHRYPLDLTQADVAALARSWPALETLVLNADPALLSPPGLTLHALVPFAQHCPNLRELGLFLDASAADIPPDVRVLPRLQRLGVGVSCIAEEGAVALFLSRLCPLGCALAYGVVWEMEAGPGPDSDGARGLVAEIHARCARWRRVEELLPLLTRLRAEERLRTRELVEERDDLRARVRVLGGGERLSADGCLLS